MKKLVLVLLFSLACISLRAAENQTAPSAVQSKDPVVMTEQERHKIFKKRNKEIRKLVKQYKKANAEQKTQIKARLAEIVSVATDEGIARSKERIAAEKANLQRWENKINEQEQNLDEVKARRVDEILSGEAQRRHKLAKKRWKKELKDRKKQMK